MANLEESEENWVSTIDNLCSKLNIDATAAKKSKESFLEIKKHYTLEGDPLHWIACALYVACRSSLTPTVQPGMAVEGNCVSLTRLLRLCNVSLIQFFTKIKNWIEMASMPVTFKDRISRLEHKFAVSTVLFRKFHPIFQEIFTGLTNEPVKTNNKSKKHKLQPCSTNAVFEFSWVLYCCVKGEFHSSADDLVDMYHLLLSCLDFVFANAYMAQRTDLINPCLKVLPSDWLTNETPPKKAPCIIATLCELKHGLSVEAATMKEYSFRPVIKKFFEKELLKGDDEMLGVLDILNFDSNFKSLNNLYETYVLSVGEFDERIFLGEHANEQLGNSKKVSGDEISQVIANFGPSSRACPDTPLTGRKYLAHRAEELTPVSEATNSLARLGAYLRQTKPQPSPQMMRFFSDCGVSEETITSNVIEPCNAWTEKFSQSLREIRCSNETIAIRKNMVTCLYYKIFEYILKEEHRKKPQVSLQMLLTQETYQLTVYACCTEIVLHAYSIHSLRFPTVLQIYGLSAFHFYKIIELIVQALVDKMSRDVIKHLNAVEEQVLESLVWTSESPLWEQLKKFPAPSSVEVCANESPNRRNASGLLSPVSAAMRYISPAAEQAKKQLFKDNIKPGQSLLVQSSMKPDGPAPPPASSPAPPANAGAVDTTPVTPSTTPKKGNNSLMLFFRKFYSLAVVRMNDLCTRLNVSDEELKKKIWTCLEFSIMNQTQLLKDRHLDQLLMCAVYVICKVSNNANQQVERTFAEIMRCYRQRPLADNHVYRSVLIKPATEENQAERGDLIDFYNKVYVQCMQSFALRFTGRNKEECGLSPLPARRGARWSPGARRLCARHQLSVKPLTSPPPPQRRLTYRFSRSPAKDLHAINTMVCEVSAIKRALSPGGAAAALRGDGKRARLAAPGVARKLQGLLQDRRPL